MVGEPTLWNGVKMAYVFFFFYSAVSFLIYLIALPFLFIFSFKSKYRHSIPARFFLWKNPPLKPDGIWFHSCSFGEAKAIKPLVEALPPESLRMSTTTQTGFDVISDYTEDSAYLPFEPLLFFWMKPQKVLVVMEAEFWYLLFSLAKKRGAKTLLVNARMSDSSFPKYQRISWLYRQIFNCIDEVYAQTQTDKIRLEQLGAKNVKVTGNIKLSALPQPTKQLPKPEGMVVCGASTHDGEEELILEAYLALKKQESHVTLLLAPRHPERFGKVSKMAEVFSRRHGLNMQRYSEKREIESDIVVVDVLGELVNLYAISDVVILGGAFEPIGGHNAAEAAQFGCKIISGKYYDNQRDIFASIEGIAIVEASNLNKRLLQHTRLKPAAIKVRTEIKEIIESIEKSI
jgi:3-deoxy-D-manno-octulosonic-acid transferase